MMLKWKDGTSYSQRAPRVQTCWTAQAGPVRLSVLTSHIYYPGKWVGHAHPLFDTKPLNVAPDDVEGAKAALVELTRLWLQSVTESLSQGETP